MSVSGIHPGHMEVRVLCCRLYPWRHFYVVIEYGGRKYRTRKIRDEIIMGTFKIDFIEGLNEMDIFLSGNTDKKVGAGKFILDEGFIFAAEIVPLYTTSGSQIGDVILDVEFSGMDEIPDSALEYNVDIEDISGKKITTGEELESYVARNEFPQLSRFLKKEEMLFQLLSISSSNGAPLPVAASLLLLQF